MSAESYTRHYILCDHGEDCEAQEAVREGTCEATAREYAAKAGWLMTPEGDWCPAHAAEAIPAGDLAMARGKARLAFSTFPDTDPITFTNGTLHWRMGADLRPCDVRPCEHDVPEAGRTVPPTSNQESKP